MEVINSENTQDKRKNRKRKKKFLSNARKYAKKGTFGRGSHLSEDTYQYFVRVLELYKEGFATEEEKLIFANNVFEQTENEEINYSCNQIGCRVIETLLPFANIQILERYINAFGTNLRPICSDRFASHVLQALLSTCCAKSLASDVETEEKTKCQAFTIKISKFLLNNLEDFVNDPYGNHIIRTVFQSLSGLPNDNDKKDETKVEIKRMPEEYTEIVKEYATRLVSWPQFKDLPYNEKTSGLLQVLLQAIYNIDLKLLKIIQKKLIKESYAVISDGNKLPDVYDSKPATMLLETSVNVAVSKIYTQIYAKCFMGHLPDLAKRKENNFTVQKLLNNCKEKSEFEAMFDELSDHFEEILQCRHTGVILSLAQSCKRLSAKQGNFVQQLMKALHCLDPQERQNSFVMAVARLVPFERLEAVQKEHYFINLHGSVILQLMLEFNKPIKIVTSILSMDTQELEKLFSDSKGSHVIDSFMKSQYVGEKSREKLIRQMQGTYHNLVVTKYGSRSFEAIWNVANLKQRTHIMDELSYKDGAWITSQFGIIIAGKVNLPLYKRNKDDWIQFIGKSDKTKNLFADIIEEK